MKLISTKKTARASTLVEVIVAMTVLAILGTGVMGAFKYGFFMMEMVRHNQRATQVMLAKMESVRLYSWDQIAAGFIPTTNWYEPYDPQGDIGSQGITYTGKIDVTDFPVNTSYATNLRQLTLTLQWQTQGILRTRRMSTFISKDGLQLYVY